VEIGCGSGGLAIAYHWLEAMRCRAGENKVDV